MYVCICNGITDTTIREAAEAGVSSLTELTMRTGCAASCGSCAGHAAEILAQAQPKPVRVFNVPLFAAA